MLRVQILGAPYLRGSPVSYTHLEIKAEFVGISPTLGIVAQTVLIYFALVSNPVAHLSVGRKEMCIRDRFPEDESSKKKKKKRRKGFSL